MPPFVLSNTRIEKVALNDGSERENIFSATAESAHAGELGSLSDDMSARTLNGAGTDEVTDFIGETYKKKSAPCGIFMP